jgi:uncharacterized protein (TIGR02284 family)
MATDNTGATNYNADDTGEAVRQLNSLLRGEISAAETYKMAIDKIADGHATGEVSMLRQFQEEHGRAAQELRERIRSLGGEPSDSSGAWGAWAQTVQGTMNLFGDAAALKSLKEGEEHGLKDYQEALDDIDVETASLIQSEMIPNQQKHISMLDQLINAAGQA